MQAVVTLGDSVVNQRAAHGGLEVARVAQYSNELGPPETSQRVVQAIKTGVNLKTLGEPVQLVPGMRVHDEVHIVFGTPAHAARVGDDHAGVQRIEEITGPVPGALQWFVSRLLRNGETHQI